ncbi:MAG: dipeptidase [Candidatus Dormibacteraeota bacterium]|nr:dipeptidase [Candidatus Dormibacteraeota bacterium]
MLDDALRRAKDGRGEAEADFVEFLKIPSVSSLPAHDADTRRACDWTAERLRRMGMTVEVAEVPGGRHPVISAEWLGRPGKPTLAIYGHYDVQPPDPLEEWLTPPFEPTIRDGRVYARGACDNKGQVLAGIKAAEHAFATGGPPLNLRFLVEGEEEISGPSLPRFLRENAARIPSDYVLIADGEFTAPGLPNLLTGLRGLLYTEILAEGAAADLHSGIFGGVAPNPLNTLAHVIAALKETDGRITIPGFYDDVVPPMAEEVASWDRFKDEATLKRLMGVRALEGEEEFSPAVRTWGRPTLDVHGIVGGFIGQGSKTVIPARAKAKVSMRLVPHQDPDKIHDSLATYLKGLETPGVKLTLATLGKAVPVLAGVDHPGIAAARMAFVKSYGAEPVLVREGGSVPVTVDFQEALKPMLMLTGFGLPDDSLHSPNEKMDLEQYHLGTEMVLHLMEELVAGG